MLSLRFVKYMWLQSTLLIYEEMPLMFQVKYSLSENILAIVRYFMLFKAARHGTYVH